MHVLPATLPRACLPCRSAYCRYYKAQHCLSRQQAFCQIPASAVALFAPACCRRAQVPLSCFLSLAAVERVQHRREYDQQRQQRLDCGRCR